MAIRRVKQAWEAVKAETITNCFKHCGCYPADGDSLEDPFADLDEQQGEEEALGELVQQFHLHMTLEDYLHVDEVLRCCLIL